jgi:uncharacterized protein YndB with AHSA1/START domain
MTVAPTSLPHRLDRTLVIHASRDTVFSFFTDSARWARWWGAGSTVDARPGGRVYIRHPNGIEAAGEMVELQAPERVVFTYGYPSGKPVPEGSSRVTIRLDAHPQGTLLQLVHEFADPSARDEHVQGWRFQLSLFANVVADLVNGSAPDLVDRWFAAWNDADARSREEALAAVAAPGVRFHDRYACIEGLDDLAPHLATIHRFTPGMRIERRGDVRHCQGSVLADWVAVGPDGQEKGRGTNLFVLGPDARVRSVTGFWTPAPLSAATA